jgi:hypothetical protein
MDLPPGKALLKTLKPGVVYYFSDSSFDSNEPHYFVVLNTKIEITEEERLIAICATSQVTKKQEYISKRKLPESTLCILNGADCSFLKKETAFNGNTVHEFTIMSLYNKLVSKEIKKIKNINEDVLKKLRSAVIASPEVSPDIKTLVS